MGNFDLFVAALFSLLVCLLGLSFSRSGRDRESFFAAGGSVPWWISGLSLFMSFFSVGTFVVWGSIAFSSGVVAIVIQTTMSIAGFLVGYFIAPKWNNTRALTAAQFVAERLGTKTQKFYTTLFLFLSLFSAGAFLYPVGKMIEVSTGLPLYLSIIILGSLIVLYTTVGGLWAVLVTDVLQFVVLSSAVIMVLPLSLFEVGGLSEFIQAAPADFFAATNQEFDWLFMAAFGFYNMVFIGGSWGYVQRYTSVATPQHAKKVGILFGSLYLIAPVIWMIPPMVYRVIVPDVQAVDPEDAYLLMIEQVVPVGIMGLMFGAMVFATASSVNTTLNIAAGVFTNDIYSRFRPTANNRETMRVAKSATIVFGLLAILVALSVKSMGGIVEVAFSLAAITGVALFLPPIWAMYSSYQTGRSAITSTIAGLMVSVFFKFITPSLFNFSLSRSAEMCMGVAVPVVILALYEIYARLGNHSSVQYDQYQQQVQARTLQAASQVIQSNNTYGVKILSIGVISIGVIIIGLGTLAEKHAQVVVFTGIIVLLSGGLLFRHNNKTVLANH